MIKVGRSKSISLIALLIGVTYASPSFAQYFQNGLLGDPNDSTPMSNVPAPPLRTKDIQGLSLGAPISAVNTFFSKQDCRLQKTIDSYTVHIYSNPSPIRNAVIYDCSSPTINWHVVVLPPIVGATVFSIKYAFKGNYFFPDLVAKAEAKYGLPVKQVSASNSQTVAWDYSNLSIDVGQTAGATPNDTENIIELSYKNMDQEISGPLARWETNQLKASTKSTPSF